MKKTILICLGLLTAFVLGWHPHAVAENLELCFIFSGNAQNAKALPITKFNRITFEPDGMVANSSVGSEILREKVPFNDYNRFYVDMAVSGVTTGIEDMQIEEYLRFDSKSKVLSFVFPTDESRVVNIYNMSGGLVWRAEIRSEGNISVAYLLPGLYIAAVEGHRNLILKFIIK